MTQKGYVFINEEGEYAVEGEAGGFGTGKVIHWDADINRATVFLHKNPWEDISVPASFKVLAQAQPLMAVANRVVVFQRWKEEQE